MAHPSSGFTPFPVPLSRPGCSVTHQARGPSTRDPFHLAHALSEHASPSNFPVRNRALVPPRIPSHHLMVGWAAAAAGGCCCYLNTLPRERGAFPGRVDSPIVA
jgi:hypothetical protein